MNCLDEIGKWVIDWMMLMGGWVGGWVDRSIWLGGWMRLVGGWVGGWVDSLLYYLGFGPKEAFEALVLVGSEGLFA